MNRPSRDSSVMLKAQEWATLRLYLVWTYLGPPKRRVWGPDPEQTTQFYFLHKGHVTITTDQAIVSAPANHWIITTSRKREHRFSEDALITSINLKAHWADDRPLFPDDPPLRLRAAAAPRLNDAARKLLKMTGGNAGDLSGAPVSRPTTLAGYLRFRQVTHSLLRAYASAMLLAGRRQNGALAADSRVSETQRLLDTHPLTSWVNHEQAARGLGLSESHLSRLFVEHFGITPRQYELKRRLTRARELLQDSTLPIKHVAYLLGFRQPSHFTAWFHKHAGHSPRQHRNFIHPDVAGPV